VSRRRGLRWGLAGAAAVAIVAALVILPPWGTPEHAFATWTRAPEPVPVSALDEIATQCSQGSYSAYWEKEALITEERGRVTFVVARSSTMLNHCLLVDGEFAGAGGIRDTSDDEIAADDARLWMAASGGRSMEEDDRYTAITGEVGEDVVGGDLHPLEPDREPGGGDGVDLPESVAATVDDGYFGAWWPGATSDWHLTLHLTDGSTVERLPAFEHDR